MRLDIPSASPARVRFEGARGERLDRFEIQPRDWERALETLLPRMRELTRGLQPHAETLRYLVTLGRQTPSVLEAVAALIAGLGHDDYGARRAASAALRRMGYPAYVALSELESADAEVRYRAREILAALEPAHREAMDEGLHRDVELLSRLAGSGEAALREPARRRLEAILPAEAKGSADWWRANREELTWNEVELRYVRR